MKNDMQNWNKLNKNGIKLSLVCGLNWLVEKAIQWQLWLALTIYLGVWSRTILQKFSTVESIILGNYVFIIVLAMLLLSSKNLKGVFGGTVKLMILYYVFIATLTEKLSINYESHLLYLVLMSGMIYLFGMYSQPKLFQQYLFKHVIDKDYLGIRNKRALLPPLHNVYVDAKEKDAGKRMRKINQHVIKAPYQDVVELSFLN